MHPLRLKYATVRSASHAIIFKPQEPGFWEAETEAGLYVFDGEDNEVRFRDPEQGWYEVGRTADLENAQRIAQRHLEGYLKDREEHLRQEAAKANRGLRGQLQDLAEDIRQQGFEDYKHRYQLFLQQLHDAGQVPDRLRRQINQVNRALGSLRSNPDAEEQAAQLLEQLAATL